MTTENSAQIEFWNGETGQNWVTHDALMEDMLQPLGEAVMSVLAPIAGERAELNNPTQHAVPSSCCCNVFEGSKRT